jgi:hypothetical protein
MKKSYKLLIIGLLLLVILSPALLTQISGIISFNSDSGAIGDTIGGVTSPIVNILGAVLIYISFQEQVKANTQQIENQNIDRFRNDYEEIKKEFYQVGFNEKEIHEELSETDFESPIDIYCKDLEIRKEGNIIFEYQFKYILYLIQYFIEELEKSDLSVSNKELFIKKIYQFYYSRIEYNVDLSLVIAVDNKYEVPFIIQAKKVSELIKKKRIAYSIKDSGTF